MRGIGLDDRMTLLVSEGVNGSQMVKRLFWDFAGRPISLPKNAEHYPLDQFVAWHRGQVFRV
ncbi:restriction endonuclease [Serratia sp. S1B]|nr:restriction endonuclease [Serratia sp. S1B]